MADEFETTQKRQPLLRRAAMHAFKTLVRKHPKAALGAAGAGASYAVRDLAHTGTAMLEKLAGVPQEPNAKAAEPAENTAEEQMSDEDRAALAEFARKHAGG